MGVHSQCERRGEVDRRRRPTTLWNAIFGGRRRALRRDPEGGGGYYVDRYSAATLCWIMALVILSLVDAVVTLNLLALGGDEVNPLMAHVLSHGITRFLVVKYILTTAGLPLLVIFQHFPLFGTRWRVRAVLPALVICYLALLVYQVWLWRTYGS